jgi:serine/threonine protein phosphatase PrpC
VGDCEAWLWQSAGVVALTEGQPRKPPLGGAPVVARAFFRSVEGPCTLLLGTDGLFTYAPRARIEAALRSQPAPQACCAELAQLPRLPGGGLQDDLGLVLLRWECAVG